MKCNVTRQSATLLQQADLISALCETRAWLQAKPPSTAGKIHHGSFEMLSWPHRTSANIVNTCFWLLETCTKCSYFIEENIRPGAQRLAFEVRVYRTPATNAPWAGVLRLGKFPDNRRSMCYECLWFLSVNGPRQCFPCLLCWRNNWIWRS